MRIDSKPIEEHSEVPLADDGRWEDLVAAWTRRDSPQPTTPEGGNACYVVSMHGAEDAPIAEARLREITGLVRARGDRLVGEQSLLLRRPSPRTFVGRGIAERLGDHAREAGANLLVLDAELTPSQTRNLEDACGLPVCDREAVILDVFERHATTPRSRIQVEIAHLEYLRPRIRGIGLNMDQQAGGLMGSRGPGETASELLARRLDQRLADLRRSLLRIGRSDTARRKRRRRCARVVLVGYTNAGKTSLMNALTAADLSVRDRPFETLDTTSRCLTRHGGDVLLSDTVGFIRQLPERLFASFDSTLAEVREASLLLVVVDSADPEMAAHLRTTEAVLERLEASRIPRIVVFNKVDLRHTEATSRCLSSLSRGHPFVRLSTRDSASVADLREEVLKAARSARSVREVFVPYHAHDATRQVHARCRVLRAIASERGTQFVIEGEPHVVEAIERAARSER